MNLVGVTACISGVAHTYMAAELLEKLAHRNGFKIHVETQGALGCQCALMADDIADADVVLLITDIAIDGSERFDGCRVVHSNIRDFLSDPSRVFCAANRARTAPRGSTIEL
ncbi:fructose PTS transporter subunit IIB [Aeromonas veronii]|uniref:fructose PTS transporter subunit IIB n=1 Tax=Aeromonas veronii TaxID=654 RepID=UPI001E324912|nr:fructose PTS transporter subunit IIB [Aeromonas veronii]MCD6618887.1 fructose PTS transporter subunit IIB [Aeromonas veronii]